MVETQGKEKGGLSLSLRYGATSLEDLGLMLRSSLWEPPRLGKSWGWDWQAGGAEGAKARKGEMQGETWKNQPALSWGAGRALSSACTTISFRYNLVIISALHGPFLHPRPSLHSPSASYTQHTHMGTAEGLPRENEVFSSRP